MISHDTELLAAVVNKVWFLDAIRGEVDVYNMDWPRYLEARATDEKRRRRERANAEKKASALHLQAAKMGAKATKAVAAKNMARRADKLLAGLDDAERRNDKVARIRFPNPAPCGRTPLTAEGLSKAYGSLEVFTGVDLAIDRGRRRSSCSGLNGAGKTTLLRLLAGTETPDTGEVVPGHGLRTGLLRAGARHPRHGRRRCGRTSGTPRRTPRSSSCATCSARSCSPASSSTSVRARCPAARGPGSRWPGWCRARRTCCCWTSPRTTWTRRAASRCSTRCGASPARSCSSPTIRARWRRCTPERVIVLPDGTEDHWSADYLELVQLA